MLAPEGDVRGARAGAGRPRGDPSIAGPPWAGRDARTSPCGTSSAARVADLEEQWRRRWPGADRCRRSPRTRTALPSVSVVAGHRRSARARRAGARRPVPRRPTRRPDRGPRRRQRQRRRHGGRPRHPTGHACSREDRCTRPSPPRATGPSTVATGEVIAFTDDDCRPTPDLARGPGGGAGARASPSCRAAPAPTRRSSVRAALAHAVDARRGGALRDVQHRLRPREASAAAGGFDESFAAEVAAVLGRRFGRYPFGEDTDLAWRVKRGPAGRAGSRRPRSCTTTSSTRTRPTCCGAAVVGAGWPLLLRRVPELDDAADARRRPRPAPPAGPARARRAGRRAAAPAGPRCSRRRGCAASCGPLRPGPRARPKAAPGLALRDLVETGGAGLRLGPRPAARPVAAGQRPAAGRSSGRRPPRRARARAAGDAAPGRPRRPRRRRSPAAADSAGRAARATARAPRAPPSRRRAGGAAARSRRRRARRVRDDDVRGVPAAKPAPPARRPHSRSPLDAQRASNGPTASSTSRSHPEVGGGRVPLRHQLLLPQVERPVVPLPRRWAPRTASDDRATDDRPVRAPRAPGDPVGCGDAVGVGEGEERAGGDGEAGVAGGVGTAPRLASRRPGARGAPGRRRHCRRSSRCPRRRPRRPGRPPVRPARRGRSRGAAASSSTGTTTDTTGSTSGG